jgi:hypothetical protein
LRTLKRELIAEARVCVVLIPPAHHGLFISSFVAGQAYLRLAVQIINIEGLVI